MSRHYTIAVLCGGNSNEREISLITGKAIIKALASFSQFKIRQYDPRQDLAKIFYDAYHKKIDLIFPALHGQGGEDGRLQGMLELLNIPYVGSGVLASAMGMNKLMSKRLFQQAKVLTPPYLFFKFNKESKQRIAERSKILQQIKQKIGLPCVVKPNQSGSSVGITIVRQFKQLDKAIELALQCDPAKEILVEKYIKGREITAPILGNDQPIALPIVEIVPKREFFDYRAKYNAKLCEEIVPAQLSEQETKKIQQVGQRVHQLFACRGLSRVDMIKQKDKIYVLEINTMPGMTPNSLFPKSARSAGITFAQLIEKLVKLAYEK